MDKLRQSLRVVGCSLLIGVALTGCRPHEGEDAKSDRVTTTRSKLMMNVFSPYVAYATGSRAEAVAVGDLDGDGRTDAAIVTSASADTANDHMLNVFLQASDGTLRPRVQYPLDGPSPRSLDIGDVNGDGRADVVIGDGNGTFSGISVLLQNASGTLDPPVSYATTNADQVRIGDFNGDGRKDVAGLITGSAGDGLDVLLQTAAGTLAAPVTYHVAHGAGGDLDAGDVNGDGRTDLVVSPGLSVLLQNADGTMAAPVVYAVAGGTTLAGSAVGDLNGDGFADVAVSYGGIQPGSFIARLLQDAQGTLSPATSYGAASNPGPMVVADMDPDGRKDVLVLHASWGQLGMYQQSPLADGFFYREDGSATPYERRFSIPSAAGYGPQALAVGDINNDGLPDALVADPVRGLVVLRHVSDVEPTVTITAPTPGTYLVGQPVEVSWTASADATSFSVWVSYDGGIHYSTACPLPVPGTTRSCTWTPTVAASARVAVFANDAAGNAGIALTVVNLAVPTLSVTAPAPNAVWVPGSPAAISWSSNLPASATVRVELSRNDGALYETIAAAAPNTGSLAWTVTGPDTPMARVRVSGNSPFTTAVSTSGRFSIVTAPLTVTSPAAGATVYPGLPLTVTWTSNVPGAFSVRVEISFDGGAFYQTLAASTPNIGSYSTTIFGPPTSSAIVRVTTLGSTTVSATSDLFNLVLPVITVDSPVAGASTFVGAPLAIMWHHNFPAASSMRIDLSRDGGGTFTTLAASAPDTGSFAWTATGPDTANARVRVIANEVLVPTVLSSAFAIVTPTVTVSGPAAGSSVLAGAPAAITWTSNLPGAPTALIELSRDGGASFETLAAAAPNTGSFAWAATGPDTATAIARVTLNGPPTVSASSGAFAVVTPTLSVGGPAGGVVFAGTPVAITWASNMPGVATAMIELSRDGGASFETLAAAAPNTGSFAWIASGSDTAAAIARVTLNGPPVVSAVSPPFGIVTATLSVTAPAGGTSWFAGTPQTVTWTTNLPAGAAMRVELSRDGGASFETLAAAAPNTGSFTWTVSAPATATAIVRVSASDPVPASAATGAFTIVSPALSVTAPGAGASWTLGTAQTITWATNLPASDSVRVELSRNGGGTFETLAAAAPNSGSFAWTAAGATTAAAVVRVTGNGAVSAAGTSGAFAIVSPLPALAVTAPVAGASWTIGTTQAITWTSNQPLTGTARIQISRNGGSTFSNLATAAPNIGSFTWTVTGGASTTAIVRVTANGLTALSGTFSVVAAKVTVTSPNTLVTWLLGSVQPITWTHNVGLGATFKIEVSRDNGNTWSQIAAAAPGSATSGSYAWTVAAPKSDTCRIRVTWTGNTTVKDQSDSKFRIR